MAGGAEPGAAAAGTAPPAAGEGHGAGDAQDRGQSAGPVLPAGGVREGLPGVRLEQPGGERARPRQGRERVGPDR